MEHRQNSRVRKKDEFVHSEYTLVNCTPRTLRDKTMREDRPAQRLGVPPSWRSGWGQTQYVSGCGDCLSGPWGGPWCLDTNTQGGASTRWAEKTALAVCVQFTMHCVWVCYRNTRQHNSEAERKLILSFSLSSVNLSIVKTISPARGLRETKKTSENEDF